MTQSEFGGGKRKTKILLFACWLSLQALESSREIAELNDMVSQSLPLSPPKRILEKLTSMSSKRHRYGYTCRIRAKERRAISASEVLEKVQRWKYQRIKAIEKKKDEFQRRMKSAREKRDAVLEDRRDTARRFSEDAKIWGKFKVKLGISEDPTVDQIRLYVESAPVKLDFFTTRLKAYIIRRKLQQTIMSLPLEELIALPYNQIQKSVQSFDLRSVVRHSLSLFRLHNVFPVPIENIFLSALLLLSDHTTNEEKVYMANLGSSADAHFKPYATQWMKDIQVLDDKFAEYVTTRLLVHSRHLILHFQRVYHSFTPYSTAHLRLLRAWRVYLDLFRVFQVMYLSRCLLLLCNAMDVLMSGNAIAEFVGSDPDNQNAVEFQKRKDVLVRQLAQWKWNSQSSTGNEWCFLGGLQDRVDVLLSDFERFQQRKVEVSGNVLMPPGFTVEEWQRFRLEIVLDGVTTKRTGVTMKTGFNLLKGTSSELESVMKKVGMTTFQDDIECCNDVADTVELTVRLFAAVGVELNGEELRFVSRGFENFSEPVYFEHLQTLFQRHTSRTSPPSARHRSSYLSWWRRTMLVQTANQIEHCMELTPYLDFAYQMGIYTLTQRRSIGTTVTDYISEISLRFGTKSGYLPINTLVVEDLLGSLRHRSMLPILFGLVEPYLRELYDELVPIVGECVLFVLGVNAKFVADVTLVPDMYQDRCRRWQALLALHFRAFEKVYSKLSSLSG